MACKILISESNIKDIVNKTISKFLLKEYGAEQRLPFDDDKFKNKNYLEQYTDWLEDFGKYGNLPSSKLNFWEEIRKAIQYIIDNNINVRGYGFNSDVDEIYHDITSVIGNSLIFNSSGNLYIEREVRIDGSSFDYDKSLENGEDPKLLYNSLVKNYNNNVGGCWSYNNGQADSYCTTGTGDNILMRGFIRLEDIDFVKTVLLNFNYPKEYEIRVKPKAKVELFQVIFNCRQSIPLKGHLIVSATYFGNNRKYHGSFAPVDDGFGNQEYIDREGNIVDKEKMFKYAFNSGEALTEFFDEVKPFGKLLYKLNLNDKYYLCDKKGNLASSCIGNNGFENIEDLNFDYAIVDNGKKESLVNRNGNLIGNGKLWFEEVIYKYYNTYLVDLNGKMSLIIDGQLISDGKLWFDKFYGYKNEFTRIKNDGRYGFIDANGNLVGNEIKWFDNAKDFNENGLALCELNGNTYTLDSKGELHRIEQYQNKRENHVILFSLCFYFLIYC